MSKKYTLSDLQLRHLAIICYREQGANIAGVKACASHMCNYFEKYQSKNFRDVYECTFGSGWYWSKAKNNEWIKEHPNVPTEIIMAVRQVICDGKRTLPDYVDEYDCLSDIVLIVNDGVIHTREREKSYVMNRHNYHKDKTLIQNRYAQGASDRYTFYCFPDGADGYCDAFGYLYKPKAIDSEPVLESVPNPVQQQASTIEKAVSWMEAMAAVNTHGYDQQYRWGERGDYDCSSLTITAWEKAGVPVKSSGATYTGNMYNVFLRCGFKDVTKSCDIVTGTGLQRGDVLLNHVHHVAVYCGNGMEVEASGNEYGKATGGQPGDQTGFEILKRPYRNYPWDCVLRYGGTNNTSTASRKTVQYGSKGADVLLVQQILNKYNYRGYNGKPLEEDGEFGTNTLTAVRAFQRDNNLGVDGIVGKMTWTKLLKE